MRLNFLRAGSFVLLMAIFFCIGLYNRKDLEKITQVSGQKITDTSKKAEEFAIIENVSSIDNTTIGWGIGKAKAEHERPIDCIAANEKYKKYHADFIREDEKKIYLTFDEGYENGYTAKILDILKKEKVPAVFFITMPYAKEEGALIRRMIKEGHIVGNHSTSHPAEGMPSLSIEAQQDDILSLHRFVKEQYGYEMHLFRNPSGKFSEQSLAVTNNLQYRSVFWSFAYYDYDVNHQPQTAQALNKLNNARHYGAIYLLHAVSATDTAILTDFIEQSEKEGYTFANYNAQQ